MAERTVYAAFTSFNEKRPGDVLPSLRTKPIAGLVGAYRAQVEARLTDASQFVCRMSLEHYNRELRAAGMQEVR